MSTVLFFCSKPADSRVPDYADQTEMGPPVNLDLVELRHFVKEDMSAGEMLRKHPKTNGLLTFEKPIPFLYLGEYYPVDKIVRYLGAGSKRVEGNNFSGYQTQERRYITFLFFRDQLKFFVLRHEIRENDDFELTEYTTVNFRRFVDDGGDSHDFFPHGGCIWQLYRQMYENVEPLLQGHCYWDRPGFTENIADDAEFQGRLRNGYESTVDVSTLPKEEN
ncbi:MAG: hypothetical protein KDK33_15655 [Leptospiraceae bacterium]|nr:hypothetical protein [Leptospiraceae bacterium]